MTSKDPYTFPCDTKTEQRDDFYLQENRDSGYIQLVDYCFRRTALTFLGSFLLAVFTVSLFGKYAAQSREALLGNFLAGSIFFLPVIFAAVFTRLRGGKLFLPEVPAEKVLPFLPYFSGADREKKRFFLLLYAFCGGVLLQAPVLVLGFIQKHIFLFLGVPLSPQTKAVEIAKLAESGNIPGLLLILIPTLLFAPVAEELFFRMTLFEKLCQYGKKEYIFWVSCILFALFHGNLSAFLPLLLVGYICQKLYIKTTAILPSILLHFSFNLSSVLLLFLSNAK